MMVHGGNDVDNQLGLSGALIKEKSCTGGQPEEPSVGHGRLETDGLVELHERALLK